MNYKKLIFAFSICLIAGLITFLLPNFLNPKHTNTLTNPTTRNTKETTQPKIKIVSQINKPKTAELLKDESITVHKKESKPTGDPYQDLLQQIENGENQVTEEEKAQSLEKYLATTVNPNELEQIPQTEPNNSINQEERGSEEVYRENSVEEMNPVDSQIPIYNDSESRETRAED